MNISEIADNIRTKNIGGTQYRGNVATTGQRYEKALQTQEADPKRLVREVQKTIVNSAKALAENPDALSQYLRLVKATVNHDILQIAKHFRKKALEKKQDI
jgi:hypothetical protein